MRKTTTCRGVFDTHCPREFNNVGMDSGMPLICEYKGLDYHCEYQSDATGDGFCILHSPNPEKSNAAFEKALVAHRMEEGDIFIGFIFPASFGFGDAEFRGDVVFRNVNFIGNTDFSHVKFGGNVNFFVTTFGDDASFENVKFSKDAFFERAQFHRRTIFDYVDFEQDVSFWSTRFGGHASFRGSQFKGRTSFWGTVFAGGAQFTKARFLSRTLFVSTSFGSAKKGPEFDFMDVIIEPSDAIVFRDADLSRCRFLGTDLRKTYFSNVVWPQIGDRLGIHDEYVLYRDNTNDWGHVENLYRQLKQNHEDHKDYERIRDFHYGEKEMRRKNPSTSTGLRVLLTLYWLVSGYGERYFRPLIAGGILLLLSTVGFLLPSFGLKLKLDDGLRVLDLTSAQGIWDWLAAAHYTFRVMSLLKPDELAIPLGHSKILFTIDSILGPILIGLFALAVRQRLKR
jgi:uncharacterized protein YjbI with pentapeptide repeats